ncbi:MAG: hypothetical protein WBI77_09640 [Tepidanaerobacteraceae bacterium]
MGKPPKQLDFLKISNAKSVPICSEGARKPTMLIGGIENAKICGPILTFRTTF